MKLVTNVHHMSSKNWGFQGQRLNVKVVATPVMRTL